MESSQLLLFDPTSEHFNSYREVKALKVSFSWPLLKMASKTDWFAITMFPKFPMLFIPSMNWANSAWTLVKVLLQQSLLLLSCELNWQWISWSNCTEQSDLQSDLHASANFSSEQHAAVALNISFICASATSSIASAWSKVAPLQVL